MGIEPASSAWEADILPMNYTCPTSVSIAQKKRLFNPFFYKFLEICDIMGFVYMGFCISCPNLSQFKEVYYGTKSNRNF